MQEEYLHYLWRLKRLRFNHLQLANIGREEVEIEETGWYNTDAGPDFFNGCILIDGIRWYGNIEMHLKSSDWYAHKHHLDAGYNNVVLHVVYEHNKEVEVNGRVLPTIELKNQIDQEHLQNYRQLLKQGNAIPCANQVNKHLFALEQQINVSLLNRIERKGSAILQEMSTSFPDKQKILLFAIFKAVGGRVNRLPMLELVRQIPYKIIQKERWSKARLDALFFGCAGLIDPSIKEEYVEQLWSDWELIRQKYSLSSMKKESWKFGGIRPYSFPTIVLAQLSALFFQLDTTDWEKWTAKDWKNRCENLSSLFIHSYWKDHFRFGKKGRERTLCFSKIFVNNLLINGVVPALIVLNQLNDTLSYIEIAMDLLELLPAEKNQIVNKWKEYGFQPKNALESQGLIELNNEYCAQRKCLSCKVGCEILEKQRVMV